MELFEKSLFIFRRDLRLEDNTGLLAALKSSKRVMPCFILDPRQLQDNPYRSEAAVAFMRECLEDLDAELRKKGPGLNFLTGEAEKVLDEVIVKNRVQAVFFNRDYTLFSIRRDKALNDICGKHGVPCFTFNDALLNSPENVRKDDGNPYTVFTPFFKRAQVLRVESPQEFAAGSFSPVSGALPAGDVFSGILKAGDPAGRIPGGRRAALGIFKGLSRLADYQVERDIPALDKTSRLSAHNKFGTVSIREVYYAIAESLDRSHPLIRQLYWRDFFTHVAYNFPYVFEGAFQRAFDRIEWEENEEHFQAWCGGCTGFPIVDAGMRELNATGYMHNRVRMITASFLVKDLHIDWRRGEEYFARRLVDYDPCVNNGNWQWSASTGCDAQPWFRIFNPWLQQKRFDPACEYIKKWVPELDKLTPAQIHRLEGADAGRPGDYPAPIVDHMEEKTIAEESYQQALERSPDGARSGD